MQIAPYPLHQNNEIHVTDFGRGEGAKQKETPTEGQGLPVSAGHLALNA
jgi:hypothetical protein